MNNSLEQSLYDERIDELIIEDDSVSANIVDEELDLLNCTFDYSNTVTINTEGYSYITLSPENLNTLKRLIRQSEIYFKQKFEQEKD